MNTFKITKPVRLIETFSGIGAQAMALKRLGVNFEYWKTSDWDVNAVKSYKAIHHTDDNTDYSEWLTKEELIQELYRLCISTDGKKPMTEDQIRRKNEKWLRDTYNDFKASHNLGSITNIHAEDLEIGGEDYTHILTYSFPCFIEGTLVLTKDGYKEIQDIQVGEYVLTHTNSWQKVIKTMTNKSNDLVCINCMPSEKIYCTPNHPFYVRKMHRVHNPKTGWSERQFDNPEWVEAKDLSNEYYVGTAINQIEEIPIWNGVNQKKEWEHNTHVNRLQSKFESEDFWYVIGRYIGDGWISSNGRITICAIEEEVGQIIPFLDRLDFHYSISDCRTCCKIFITFKEIGAYCEQFGRGAGNKHLTADILNLPVSMLKAFLNGYMDADGTYTQNKYKASSVSRRLIYEIAQCVHKVYHRHTSIYYTQRKKTTVIEGRVVNQKDSYSLTFTLDKRPQDHAFYEDGYIWSPIKIVENENSEELVYNLEVENDNSYQIQNVIVHNCTDLSLAGRQKGMDKGSGTSSALIWEIERILRECKELNCLPDVLLMENVTQVHGTKNLGNWNSWLGILKGLGYKTYWKDLNAKHYGTAQNRDRCFAVSLLSDLSYEFPEPIELTKRLKDYLEESVDEKYYISSDKANKLIISLIERGVLPERRQGVDLSINQPKQTEIANCIAAKTDRGISNRKAEGTGVLEKEFA